MIIAMRARMPERSLVYQASPTSSKRTKDIASIVRAVRRAAEEEHS